MSYSILYRSMFVKICDDKYIPMIECGDNNVWDCNYGRGRAKRSRSWCNLGFNGIHKHFFTHNDLLEGLNGWKKSYEQKRMDDANSDEEWKKQDAKNGSFGYYMGMAVASKKTYSTTFNSVKNLVLSGEKMAISFDKAVNDFGLYIVYYESEDDYDRKEKHFKTEEEMVDIVNNEMDGKTFWFVYNNELAIDKFYKTIKAMKSFAKLSGKGKQYIVQCTLRDTKEIKYVSLKNDVFELSDNPNDAIVFDKGKSSGMDIFELIFNLFSNICSIHLAYGEEIKKLKEAA